MTETVERRHPRPRRQPRPDRITSAHQRQPPGFVIIGAQKGGTTSLFRYLTEHPDVGGANKKEVHFFDFRFHKGMDWYLAHFPPRGKHTLVGEASPSYLFHPEVPGRVRAALPQAKLIVLLRNPVDRAYAHYQMNVGWGFETLPFEAAISQEPERMGDSGDLSRDWQSLSYVNWRRFSYVSRGVYVDQLQRWLSVFPREQVLVIKSEELYEEPERIYDQTLKFLDLRPWRLTSYEHYNRGAYAGMHPETRERLADYFAPHNRQLYDLLGWDLGWDADDE